MPTNYHVLSFLAATVCLMPTLARAATSPEELLQQSGAQGGLVVLVGCEDHELLLNLGAKEGYLVHGLDTHAERVGAAIAAIRAGGLGGKASAARFDGRRLPYIDNAVNLLVIQNTAPAIEDSEILRVLAPGGVALIGDERIVKDVPNELDNWTHHMYDASGIGAGGDTAVSRPRSIQWKAGPEYGRSHENMSSVSSVVSAGGRVFSIMDEGPPASIYLPPKWFLTARDAFSGVLLWKRPISEWHARLFPLKSGPLQLPRRIVATNDRVYVTLGIDEPVSEIDAATGRVLRTFADTAHAEELLHVGGRLIVVANTESAVIPYRGKTPGEPIRFSIDEKSLNMGGGRSIVLIDTKTGRTAWKSPAAEIIPLTIASDGRRVFVVRGQELAAIDVADGQDLWATSIAKKQIGFRTAWSPTLLVHQDIVYLANEGTLTARDADTGETLWSAPCATAGYQAPASIFIVDGLIWDVAVGSEPYRPGTDLTKINRYFTGYDLRTGEVVRRIPVSSEHGYGIMHHRCHIPRASGGQIITSFPGIEFFDVETGDSTHDSWVRGACLYGFMPANGLIYAPPHPCACYTQGKLTGFWAVGGERPLPEPDGADRLEKGPAYGKRATSSASARSWPTYRGDPARSGRTSADVPLRLREAWTAEVGSDLTQCVIADGKLFLATREDHTVHALDARSGAELWRFIAGGRVDSPPTYYNRTVLFGSRDGHVYCLAADTGRLAWRFRAAPTDQRCVVYDQLESVWPVHGSVLVENDLLWCSAGRSSFLDGGLLVHRLDPSTGELLSTTRVDTLGEDGEQPPITPTIFARLDMEGAKNDVLSCDGEHVFMRHWAFDRSGASVPRTIDHLFSPTGFLDTSWFRRTYWLFGRAYVSGAQGWARAGNVRPSGRIMSVDDSRLYGFGRDYYPPSPSNQHQMYLAGEAERLYACRKGTAGAPLDGAGAAPRKKPLSATGGDMLWSTPTALQVRCMLLAGKGDGKRLLVAGAKGDWMISQDAYEGRLGNVLRILSADDGETLAEYELPACPVFDAMSSADGRLYIAFTDGRVVCYEANDQ